MAWVTHDDVREAVVVDVPLGEMLLDEIAGETGVAVQTLQLYEDVDGPFDDAAAPDAGAGAAAGSQSRTAHPGARQHLARQRRPVLGRRQLGRRCSITPPGTPAVRSGCSCEFDLALRQVYEHLSESAGRINEISIAQLLLAILAIVAVLFLIILAVAFLMGFVLARSITGAVHELFEGTEKVRSGDFSHKIVVHSRDQLGELAESFNSMTASIEDLLRAEGAEGAPRAGAAHRARHPDVAAAAGAARSAAGCRLPGTASRRAKWAATTTTSGPSTSTASPCSSPTSPARARRRRSTWPS